MVMAEECKVSGAVVCVVLMNGVEMSFERVKVELVFGNFEGDDKVGSEFSPEREMNGQEIQELRDILRLVPT